MAENKKFGSSFRSALTWNMLNIGVGQVMTLGIFLLLTTQLSPAVFGIFALALVFIDFFNFEGRYSIIDSIVQKQRFDKVSLSTSFWVTFAIFGSFAALFYAIAPLVANLFGYQDITVVLRALSLTLLIVPFSIVPMAVLNQRRDFKNMTLRVIFAKTIGGISALIVAFGPHPEWALVVQRVMANSAEAVLLITQTRIFPSLRFDGAWAKEFGRTALGIYFAQTTAKSLLRSLDVIIASFLGVVAVGLWRIAERIMQAVFSAFANPISSLWVILLSATDTDAEEKSRIFLNLTQLGVVILVPVFIGIGLISQNFIDAFVGNEFTAVGPILGLLGLFGSMAPFYNFRNAVLIALKKTSTLIKLALLDLGLLLVLCFALSGYGIMGLVSALGVVYLVSTVLFMPIVLKEVKVKLGALIERILPAYIAGLVMGLGVLTLSPMVADLASVWQIGVKAFLGVTFYFGYLLIFHRAWLQRLFRVLLDRETQMKPA